VPSRVATCASTSSLSPHPRLDLAGPEWLDHVVVGAGVEHPDDLGLVVAGGDDDHGHRADRADHPQCLVAL